MEHHNLAPNTSQNIVPSVYVACLASYNNGMLHGKWISLDGSEEISTSIQEILKTIGVKK